MFLLSRASPDGWREVERIAGMPKLRGVKLDRWIIKLVVSGEGKRYEIRWLLEIAKSTLNNRFSNIKGRNHRRFINDDLLSWKPHSDAPIRRGGNLAVVWRKGAREPGDLPCDVGRVELTGVKPDPLGVVETSADYD